MKGFRRTKAETLPEEAQVPKANLRRPPRRFTHVLVRSEPFYFSLPKEGVEPSGTLESGTQVRWERAADDYAWVVEPRGLLIALERTALEKLKRAL